MELFIQQKTRTHAKCFFGGHRRSEVTTLVEHLWSEATLVEHLPLMESFLGMRRYRDHQLIQVSRTLFWILYGYFNLQIISELKSLSSSKVVALGKVGGLRGVAA